ncbi:MAG: hypothetical protein ACO3EP_09020, partial [Phycisphaerales bacterium]
NPNQPEMQKLRNQISNESTEMPTRSLMEQILETELARGDLPLAPVSAPPAKDPLLAAEPVGGSENPTKP